MAVKRTPQQKLNRELRRAIHSGDGYDDYMTAVQFMQAKVSLLKQRMLRMQGDIDRFFDEGGEITCEDEVFNVHIDGVTLLVRYDGDGEVSEYTVSGMRGKRDVVRRLLGLFFCVHLIPVYKGIVEATAEQLADMDNDRTLRGMSELRDLIRGDRYLTSYAVSGLDVDTEPEEGWE